MLLKRGAEHEGLHICGPVMVQCRKPRQRRRGYTGNLDRLAATWRGMGLTQGCGGLFRRRWRGVRELGGSTSELYSSGLQPCVRDVSAPRHVRKGLLQINITMLQQLRARERAAAGMS